MDQDKLKKILSDTGCRKEDAESIIKAYGCGEIKEALHKTRKDRCRLMDELHENGRKIDRIDFLIRIMEKEIKQTENVKGAL